MVLGGPPLVLAPILAALVRATWLRHTSGGPSRVGFIAQSVVEFALWLVAAWFAALVYFQEAWLAGLVLVAALAAILALDRRLCGREESWARWIAFAAVLPVIWFLLQLACYGLVVGWETAA